MSCIIGFHDAATKRTFLAAGGSAQIWSVENAGRTWLVGMDADPRYSQLCRFGLEWPENHQAGIVHSQEDNGDPLFAFVVNVFVKSLMQCFEHSYVLMKDKDGGAGMKGTVLLSTDGRFFEVTSRFIVETSDEPFAGIGDNSNRAVGSFFTSLELKPGMSAEKRIELALKAAHVRGSRQVVHMF